MKKMSNSVRAGLVAVGVLVATTSAQAALTVPAIDTTDFMTVAGVVVVAAGVIFGLRKAMTLLR